MAKVRTSPEATNRAITVDGRLVGSISSFVVEGDTEVTYWIDRSFWGQGIAGRALALLLESVPVRPLFARVASDNVGSLKGLYAAKRGSRPLIRVGCGVCQLTPQWSRSLSR
jgi:hypothetical protein